MVQESIKHFPIPLRKSSKVIAEGDFLDQKIRKMENTLGVSPRNLNRSLTLQFNVKDYPPACLELTHLVTSPEAAYYLDLSTEKTFVFCEGG